MSSRPLLETSLVEEPNLRELERRIKRLETDVANIKQSAMDAAQQGIEIILRRMFTPMHKATGVMVGEIKAEESAQQLNGKWEAIKHRIGPKLGEVIDLLLIQGPMTTRQIASATRSSGEAARQRVDKLRGQGLVEKNGAHFSLKG